MFRRQEEPRFKSCLGYKPSIGSGYKLTALSKVKKKKKVLKLDPRTQLRALA